MTTNVQPTFVVDKVGLRKVLARKGMTWLIPELLQNAWDENATEVEVQIGWLTSPNAVEPKGKVAISVIDNDPDGFKDITHAFTLFAESEKKDKSEKRGRFNVGEKLVIAACERATISTTTGKVVFDDAGRVMLPAERKHGSEFYGEVLMTQDELDEALAMVQIMFPPVDVATTVNGEKLAVREPVRTFTETLRTPVGEQLKIRDRKADISLYEPLAGETAYLYEMGIPVVPLIEGGDRWHVDIGQKVPLNIDRDNVTPAYLRVVRRIVLDNAHDLLAKTDASNDWTTDAIQDEKVGPTSLGHLLNLRFGEKRVAYDPSDPEANKIAHSQGYTVVHGGSLPGAAWSNVKQHSAILPAGQVTPSPKPYKHGEAETRQTLPLDKWTPGIHAQVRFAKLVAEKLLGRNISVEIVNDPQCMSFAATYRKATLGDGQLEYNYRTLGKKWFDEIGERQVSLLIHELAHQIESDHFSRRFNDAMSDLGARLALAVAADPDWWADAVAPVYSLEGVS